MIKKISTLGIFLVIFIMALPSEGLSLNKSDAYRTAEILKPRMVVRRYCAPCGDRTWKHITIRRVQIRRHSGDYRVIVNGVIIDPANFYIKIHGNWVNVAMLIGMNVKGVPEFLPPNERTP